MAQSPSYNAYGQDVQSVTNQQLVPQLVDTVLRSNTAFFFFMKEAGKFEGSQMVVPIKYQTGVPGTMFAGFDALPTTYQTVLVNMIYLPKFFATNVALPGDQLSVNKGKYATLSLMESTMKMRAQDMANQLGDIFYGFGVGTPTPFNGLGNIVDNGSIAGTIGGLSRATYPTLDAYVQDAGGVLSLYKIRQVANAISDGQIKPDLFIISYDGYALMEEIYLPFQRNVYEVSSQPRDIYSNTGYTGLQWADMAVMVDRKCPSTQLYLLNTDYLEFKGMNWYMGKPITTKSSDIVGNVYENENIGNVFTWTDFIHGYSVAAVNSFIIMGGEFETNDPRRLGTLTDFTTV